jgi:mRNA interferase MazF
MVPSTVGAVVLVRFPFSDLSKTKLRPALVLANTGHDDWILCQITSKPYGDERAVSLDPSSLMSGSMKVIIYVRPGKLFTANLGIIMSEVAVINAARFDEIVDALIHIIRPNKSPE